jgi:hypothetical protein
MPPIMMEKARLSLSHMTTPAGDDGLKLKGQMTVPTTPALDPAAKGIRLVLTDALGSRVLDAIIPGGSNWTANTTGTVWKYTDKPGSIGGVTRITAKDVSSKVPGLVKFAIIGANGNYAVGSAGIPLSATLVIEGPIGADNQCGDASFPGPKPAPSCAFNASGSTLTCK